MVVTTFTTSLNSTVTAIVPPTAKEPLLVEEETEVTVAGVVSTINALFAANEYVAPGLAKVNVEAFPAGSNIVPPLRANDDVAT